MANTIQDTISGLTLQQAFELRKREAVERLDAVSVCLMAMDANVDAVTWADVIMMHELAVKLQDAPGFRKASPQYTVHDVIRAGCNLEPLECLHCGHVGEVTFNQFVGDAYCGWCGQWQLNPETPPADL
jgi:hypothetical protein